MSANKKRYETFADKEKVKYPLKTNSLTCVHIRHKIPNKFVDKYT